ncbi:hypothetical protein [Streptomyces sp. NPDC059743]|uniref:hypothetical protein n=1 Tax=Streptomyces sp. NPDC059743 TaxID=3346928 RepID=UPI003662C840
MAVPPPGPDISPADVKLVRMSAAGDADGDSCGFVGSGSGSGAGSGLCAGGWLREGAGRVGSLDGTDSLPGGVGFFPGCGRSPFEGLGEGVSAELGLGDAPLSLPPFPPPTPSAPPSSVRPCQACGAPGPEPVPPSGSAAEPWRSAERDGAGFPSSSPTLIQPADAATASEVTIQTAKRPGADMADNWRTGGTSGAQEWAPPPTAEVSLPNFLFPAGDTPGARSGRVCDAFAPVHVLSPRVLPLRSSRPSRPSRSNRSSR